MRASLLIICAGLTMTMFYPHQVLERKRPPAVTRTHVAVTHHQSKKSVPAVQTVPATSTQVAIVPPVVQRTPVPAPVVVPKPVVPAPNSNVSGLKPAATSTSSTSTTTSSSSTSTSTSNSSSGGSSSSSSSPATKTSPPVSYTSTNWSGYMATTGSFTGITASWTVPTVSGNGTSTSADGAWIGIGGVSTSDLVQTGTQDIVSASGQDSTSAFYELLPAPAVTVTSISVSAGDTMNATITEVSPGSWTIAITDQTDNQAFTTTVTYSSALSSAEWIEEDPSYGNGMQVPFDTFGSVTFSSAETTQNGNSVSIDGSNASSITLVTDAGKPVAVPSDVTAGGNGFTVTQQS